MQSRKESGKQPGNEAITCPVPMYRRRDLGGATGVGDEASISPVPMCNMEVINAMSSFC